VREKLKDCFVSIVGLMKSTSNICVRLVIRKGSGFVPTLHLI
jgi:hypothetical protein